MGTQNPIVELHDLVNERRRNGITTSGSINYLVEECIRLFLLRRASRIALSENTIVEKLKLREPVDSKDERVLQAIGSIVAEVEEYLGNGFAPDGGQYPNDGESKAKNPGPTDQGVEDSI